jgi:hypothetical protein
MCSWGADLEVVSLLFVKGGQIVKFLETKRNCFLSQYALEMSSTVPIFATTKKTLPKAELLATQVSILPLPSLCHWSHSDPTLQSNPDFEGAAIEYFDQDLAEGHDNDDDDNEEEEESDEDSDGIEAQPIELDDRFASSTSRPLPPSAPIAASARADLPPPMTDLESLAYSLAP